ncbi:TRAP transporter small permease [Virgibacillus alimentarius]|uniref:TRAP-type C4-dicarboxylate transport system permease small subunit n=2 Tax=Virgibacillus alimentarius TaxID=698769 RepID=A0ABS4SAN3_9BACI|nr:MULTISPECIES: TRAP transporter small permease [Virgibacillus]MBP2258474.1 TRAP-type C4-dicarboxylate transport system permease small subunit [Virgibacillus alimentarius]HLR65753.1 TRAP transporter small permease [Virgibacillus sp.]
MDRLNMTTEWLTALFLAVMVLLIFIQIVSRLFFSVSFSWTEEVARYLMIWSTFLGASFAFKYGAHIGVEVFVRKMPRIIKNIVQIIASLASLAFFVILISMGWEIIGLSMVQTSPALDIPMGYVYIIFPISGVLMILNLIDVTIKSILHNENDVTNEVPMD